MCGDGKQSYRDAGYTPRKPDTPITEQDYEDPLKNWKANAAPPKKHSTGTEFQEDHIR